LDQRIDIQMLGQARAFRRGELLPFGFGSLDNDHALDEAEHIS
jgi:hypothetical protein